MRAVRRVMINHLLIMKQEDPALVEVQERFGGVIHELRQIHWTEQWTHAHSLNALSRNGYGERKLWVLFTCRDAHNPASQSSVFRCIQLLQVGKEVSLFFLFGYFPVGKVPHLASAKEVVHKTTIQPILATMDHQDRKLHWVLIGLIGIEDREPKTNHFWSLQRSARPSAARRLATRISSCSL